MPRNVVFSFTESDLHYWYLKLQEQSRTRDQYLSAIDITVVTTYTYKWLTVEEGTCRVRTL